MSLDAGRPAGRGRSFELLYFPLRQGVNLWPQQYGYLGASGAHTVGYVRPTIQFLKIENLSDMVAHICNPAPMLR